MIDVVAGTVLADQTVVLANGRITTVGLSSSVEAPHEAVIIAAAGEYLIPGLWDMHVHLRSDAAQPGTRLAAENEAMLDFFLPNGVVGICEMGGDLADHVIRWRDEIRAEGGEYAPQAGAPYGLFRRFLQSPSDLPCTAPAWGLLTAVDMTEGKIRWQIPLGSMQDFGGKQPLLPSGSINLGGPIVTAGGLVFIAGTFDPFLRAFDIETGKELWKAQLPASGHATPMTYRSANGKQYVVIAAGGHPKITEESLSDALVAFTLP